MLRRVGRVYGGREAQQRKVWETSGEETGQDARDREKTAGREGLPPTR